MTIKEWGSLVKLMKTIYQREEKFIPDAETAKAWFPLVEDMEFEKAKQAVNNYIKEERFAPTIADIRSRYSAILEEEKRLLREIRNSYDNVKSYYPGSGGANYGWEEFKARVKSPEEARTLSQMIFSFVRQMESEKCDKTPDFADVIKFIRKFGERLTID